MYSCNTITNQERLIGAWKVDSTYTYYNGFSYIQREKGNDWGNYVFDQTGLMKEVKHESFQSYRYNLTNTADTLILRAIPLDNLSRFAVLKLQNDQLILKKIKKPIFDGNGQLRYEIRFYSKTSVPIDSLIPFRDPRVLTN